MSKWYPWCFKILIRPRRHTATCHLLSGRHVQSNLDGGYTGDIFHVKIGMQSKSNLSSACCYCMQLRKMLRPCIEIKLLTYGWKQGQLSFKHQSRITSTGSKLNWINQLFYKIKNQFLLTQFTISHIVLKVQVLFQLEVPISTHVLFIYFEF